MKSEAFAPARRAVQYGIAIGAAVAATILRFLVTPLVGSEFPLHAYWIAVAFVSYYLGAGPAVFCALLGILAARFFFVPPLNSFEVSDPSFAFKTVIFIVYCAVMILITATLRAEHKRFEAARLRAEAAEKRVTGILDGIHDGFAIVDRDWRFAHVNPRLAEISRRPVAALTDAAVWEAFPALRGEDSYAALQRTMRDGVGTHFEDYNQPLDLWIEGDAYPSDEGITIFVRDITARKKAELDLSENAKQLQNKSELLQKSNAELEQFAYAAAHDLQLPLRQISAQVRSLLASPLPELHADTKTALESIERSADRMRALIHDLLSYSWVVSKPDAPVQPVDTAVLVDMAVMNCRALLDECNAVVETRDLPTVTCNAQLLVQVFQNLIGNAAKYRRSEPPVIRVGAARNGSEWIFSIEDNGIGIDMNYADRIFGLFKRLHGPEIPGTGLGLAICRKIVENHGGKIWVESQPGSGSNFQFTLPAGSP